MMLSCKKFVMDDISLFPDSCWLGTKLRHLFGWLIAMVILLCKAKGMLK